VFKNSPDKEFSSNRVIELLKIANPTINENSVRFVIGELKKANLVHRVRNDGYIAILRFGPHPNAQAFLNKHTANGTVKAATPDLKGDLAVLKEATAVIAKLERLVHRNQDIFSKISRPPFP
jgi:GTP1/Obg family GTP-binding protein